MVSVLILLLQALLQVANVSGAGVAVFLIILNQYI